MAIGPDSVITQDKEPIAASVDDEVVMLSARAQAYFGLDKIGTEIWSMIERPCRVGEICARLVERYEIEPQTCETDVIEFLDELLGHGLIRLVDRDARP